MSEQQQTRTLQQALDLAVQHHSAGRLSDAENIYQKILQADPNQPVALHLLGVIAHQKGKHDIAVNLISKALKLKPDYAEAHSNIGVIFREMGKLEEAESSFQKALDLVPNYADAHYNLGITLQDRGATEKAVASYRTALELQPDFADLHANLGTALLDLKHSKDAVIHLQKALSLEPDYSEAHNNLGNALRDLGKLEQAVVSYRRAIAITPDYVLAHSNLGSTLQDLGHLDEAIRSYQKALTFNPNHAEAHNNLGNALQEFHKPEEAAAHYQRAITFKPGYTEAHHNLGNVLEQQGQFQESVANFQSSYANRTNIQPIGDTALQPATTTLFLELTNKCNFHCTFCPSDLQTRSLGFMDVNLVQKAYEEVAQKTLVTKVALHLMGEPTLHPKLISILNFAASKNVKTELVTNGSTLVAKSVPKILDALYGTIVASHMTPTKETYQFRGKVGLSWDRYISNIRCLIREYMKRLANGENMRNEINLRVMVTKETASDANIIESAKEAHSLLTEWVNFISAVEDEIGIPAFKRRIPNESNLFRKNLFSSTEYRLQRGIVLTFWRGFTFANSRVSDEYDLHNMEEVAFCPHPFKDVGVLWNGDVTLCCLDHDGQLKVGNVKNQSVESVIHGERANNLRASMFGHHPLPLLCQTCQARPVKHGNSRGKNIKKHKSQLSSMGHTN